MPEEEEFGDFLFVTEEMKAKSAKELHTYLELIPTFERTYIIAVASHKESSRNFVNRISCKKGLPIGGYTYDSQSDCYHIECTDYLQLGYVPISFILRIKEAAWQVRVPMVENIFKKYLTNLQRKELKNFKSSFKEEDYNIHFFQMIDPN